MGLEGTGGSLMRTNGTKGSRGTNGSIRLARLGDVCHIEPGQPSVVGERIWWLTLDQVEQQTGRILDYIYAAPGEIGSSTVLFDEENVLYSKLRPNLNKVVLPDCPGIATSEMLPLKVTTPDLSRDYLAWYLRSTAFVSWAVSKVAGAKMPRLGTKTLMEAEIPLPPLPEQKRIAEELDNICAAKKDAEAIVEKLKLLAKSRFVEMFGDPIRNEKEWPWRPLCELLAEGCTVTYGIVQTGEDMDGGVPVFRPVDISAGHIPTRGELKRTDPKIASQYKRTELKGDELLITIRGSVGETFQVSEEFGGCNVGRNIVPLRTNLGLLNQRFLQNLIGQAGFQNWLASITKGVALKGINIGEFKNAKIILPPLELQQEFATFIERLDKSVFEAQALIGKLDLLYRAKLQEYFG